jgi:hypothetical protein
MKTKPPTAKAIMAMIQSLRKATGAKAVTATSSEKSGTHVFMHAFANREAAEAALKMVGVNPKRCNLSEYVTDDEIANILSFKDESCQFCATFP